MTRLWPDGIPITVHSRDGQPRQFTWHQQPHPVSAVVRHWRVDVSWWRVRIWRDYFKVTTHTGLHVILYRDLDSNRWFLQRLYD